MTNHEQPQNPPPPDDKGRSGHTTSDLRKYAEEAMKLLREAQESENAPNPSSSLPDEATISDRIGDTTFDLAREAQEAMRQMQMEQQKKRLEQAVSYGDRFEGNLLLRIDVSDTLNPILVDVQGEMAIGRSDTVTNYMPEVDLTKHGAYRLGLSRRHAILRRTETQLQLIDLGSRNGTLVNGTRLQPEQPHTLRSGDEIQLGNLTVRVSFQPKE